VRVANALGLYLLLEAAVAQRWQDVDDVSCGAMVVVAVTVSQQGTADMAVDVEPIVAHVTGSG